MKLTDRILQNWRTSIAAQYISHHSDVLDIGCYDAILFKKLGTKLKSGLGIDPLINEEKGLNYELKKGYFPTILSEDIQFDAITMLAVLEHIPIDQIDALSRACFQYLRPGGKLIITVPHANVDKILEVLIWLKIVDGMSVEEHHGFDISLTPEIFAKVGFQMIVHKTFQLGLNNIFVFRKPL